MAKYVINKRYSFDLVADGARPSSAGSNGILLKFKHDEVMEMGEYFHTEDPYEVDVDYNFGIKEKLDEILADALATELEEEWEAEYGDDPDEEKPDFYDQAYERMGEMYHCWDEEFKTDCVNYYLKHRDEA